MSSVPSSPYCLKYPAGDGLHSSFVLLVCFSGFSSQLLFLQLFSFYKFALQAAFFVESSITVKIDMIKQFGRHNIVDVH